MHMIEKGTITQCCDNGDFHCHGIDALFGYLFSTASNGRLLQAACFGALTVVGVDTWETTTDYNSM